MASSEPGERADTVVVGTDGSESAERAVREASWLARSTGSRLLIVSGFPHPYREHTETSAREDLVHLGAVADQLLMRAAREADGDHIEIETASREGDPTTVLSDIATEENARLVIVGDRGPSGVGRFLLDSEQHRSA
jgi:nucleotide-binding universal stress UspA family protein